jgi:hypothetical protein
MGRFVAYRSDSNQHTLVSLGCGVFQEHVVVKTKLSRQIAVRASFGEMGMQWVVTNYCNTSPKMSDPSIAFWVPYK